MVSDNVLNDLLDEAPEKAAQILSEHAKKILRPILLELRGRRDWAVFEIREEEQC